MDQVPEAMLINLSRVSQSHLVQTMPYPKIWPDVDREGHSRGTAAPRVRTL